jgi:hypothetical protein
LGGETVHWTSKESGGFKMIKVDLTFWNGDRMGIERNQQFIQESVRECRVLVLKQGSMEVVKSQDIDLDRRSKLSLCFFLSLVLCSETVFYYRGICKGTCPQLTSDMRKNWL